MIQLLLKLLAETVVVLLVGSIVAFGAGSIWLMLQEDRRLHENKVVSASKLIEEFHLVWGTHRIRFKIGTVLHVGEQIEHNGVTYRIVPKKRISWIDRLQRKVPIYEQGEIPLGDTPIEQLENIAIAFGLSEYIIESIAFQNEELENK